MAQDTVREVKTDTVPHRVLGKTGERVPILGYGSAPGGMGFQMRMPLRFAIR